MSEAAHRAFLNRFYRGSRLLYDLTRPFFLSGRDQALRGLLQQDWSSLVEVGPGTGRNLHRLHSRRPEARYAGVDASDAMLAHARARCPWATLVQGFAERADYTALLGAPPERVLFSYSLSMIQDPGLALDQALAHLAPGGEVWVVDFGSLPLLRAWLHLFHVHPAETEILTDRGAELEFHLGGYWLLARIPSGATAAERAP